MIRKTGLFLVMLGALALSFAGQMAAVRPLLGEQLAVVFALTTDLATLLGLNEVTTARRPSVRGWAWSVLLLAGGTALGLNTWHALQTELLPAPAAVAVGAGPVVLAWLLSHLMALVLTERREAQQADVGSASHTTPEPAPAAPAEPSLKATAPPAPEPAREAAGSADGSVSATGQNIPTLESADEGELSQPPASEALPAEAGSSDDAASEDPSPALIDQAERLERQYLARSGGKRGLPFREAPRRLGVRYDTARAALVAARDRMAEDSELVAA